MNLILLHGVPNKPGILALFQTAESKLCLDGLILPSNQDHAVTLEESPTMQAACEVELLNAEDFLKGLPKTHLQVFEILIFPSVPTLTDENSKTLAQVIIYLSDPTLGYRFATEAQCVCRCFVQQNCLPFWPVSASLL
jgi:hypothetical protein